MPYQMPNGKWRAKRMILGKVKTKVFTTKKEAQKWEVAQNVESWTQAETQIGTACVLDVANSYLDLSVSRHHVCTYKAKQATLSRLIKQVDANGGHEQITPRLALSLIMARARDVSNAEANKERKHLSAFYAYASKYHGWPRENPFLAVDKLPENSEPHYVPPIEDFWKVYAVANDCDKVLLLCLLYTAGRRSEPFRWTWESDIDLENKRIRLSTCKTKDGSRKYEWMAMPDKLYNALSTYKQNCIGTGHVFRSRSTGEAYVDRKHFVTKLCKRAGVKRFNFHGIRGLCATLLARENVPMKQIQGVLMHANMTTTDRYVRRIGGATDILLTAFDSFEMKDGHKNVAA